VRRLKKWAFWWYEEIFGALVLTEPGKAIAAKGLLCYLWATERKPVKYARTIVDEVDNEAATWSVIHKCPILLEHLHDLEPIVVAFDLDWIRFSHMVCP